MIRAAVLSAVNRGWEVLGVKKGYAGLLGEEEVIPMTAATVRGIAHLGGTILRTTNRGNPFSYPIAMPNGTFVEKDRSGELIENARKLGIDAVISIGGDGSMSIAHQLCERGMKIVCVPKIIDNDVSGTITTFGFDTAVRAVADEKWDHMIALQSPHIVTIPLADVLKTLKRVEIDHDTVLTARATGISFGD